MDLFIEAGVFAYACLILFVGGLIATARKPKQALSRASCAAVLVVGLGIVGQSVGQRQVDAAVSAHPDQAAKVMLLSAGTREASSCSLLAGVMALLLMGAGAGISVVRQDD